VQSLLLAERVYKDSDSGRYIVVGIFNGIRISERKPDAPNITAGSPWVYLNVTEVRKKTEFRLQYVNLKNDEVIMGCKFEIDSDDPLQVHERGFSMPKPPLDEGVHALELLVENFHLGRVRITISRQEQKDVTDS